MPDLASTLAADFIRYYRTRAETVYELLEDVSDDQLWQRPFPFGNSIGHLLLHLTGNLSFYIGAQIAGTGYERDRPREFGDPSQRSKDHLLGEFSRAMAMVEACLGQQSENDWGASYAAKGMEQAGNRLFAFLACAGHLEHHIGQIIYLTKELNRSSSQEPAGKS